MSSIIPLCAGAADLRQCQRRVDANGAGTPQKANKNRIKRNFGLAFWLHRAPQCLARIARKSLLPDLFLIKPAASRVES
jgi:hypothetical protein